MSIASTAKNAGAVGQLVLIAGGIYAAYKVYDWLTSSPGYQEPLVKGWFGTAFGDLTLGAVKSYGDFDDWYDEVTQGGTGGGYYNSNPDAVDSTGQTTVGSGSYWGGLAP